MLRVGRRWSLHVSLMCCKEFSFSTNIEDQTPRFKLSTVPRRNRVEVNQLNWAAAHCGNGQCSTIPYKRIRKVYFRAEAYSSQTGHVNFISGKCLRDFFSLNRFNFLSLNSQQPCSVTLKRRLVIILFFLLNKALPTFYDFSLDLKLRTKNKTLNIYLQSLSRHMITSRQV